MIDVDLIASAKRVAVLKSLGQPYPKPVTIKAVLDTGASGSAVDPHVLTGMGLAATGSAMVHTPSTGPQYVEKDEFDVCVVLTAENRKKMTITTAVISADLASEGFLALLGWDILRHCVLRHVMARPAPSS